MRSSCLTNAQITSAIAATASLHRNQNCSNHGAGVASDLKGAYPDARRFFTKAIQLAPEEKKVQALTGIAISYAFDRDASNAARFWQQAFDRQTTASEYAGAADTANALGAVYLESGDAENALKWYQTAYETARREPNLPGDQLAMYDLRWAHAQARIAARKGKAAEARKQAAMVKALVEKGTSPEQEIEYLFLLGYVDFYLKNYREAIAELRKADQSDPVVLVLLAQAYEKTRDRASARELYGKVMTSNMHSVNNAFARPLARRKVAARQ